jgi:hypothetical protein
MLLLVETSGKVLFSLEVESLYKGPALSVKVQYASQKMDG